MGQYHVLYTYEMPIRVWDIPYTYGPLYAYGAEHLHPSGQNVDGKEPIVLNIRMYIHDL